MKPIISPFITGYHILQYMFNKFIHLMLFCTFETSAITRKAIIHMYNTITKTIISTPNVISNWINKPRIWYTNNRRKTSHGSGKYSKIFRASKNSWYNKRNYKSGRHGRRHKFLKHKSGTKLPSTDTSCPDLKIKTKKSGVFKSLPPQRRNECFVLSVVAKLAKILMTMNDILHPTTSPT